MAKKKEAPKVYIVLSGCDTSDGTRYEKGDSYLPELHAPSTTEAFLELGCIEEQDGNNQ